MIKSELIDRVSKSARSLHPKHVEDVINAIFEGMTSALAEEKRIELRGFGIFYVKRRTARVGRNSRTGEIVAVSGKLSLHFKAGKSMQQRINQPVT